MIATALAAAALMTGSGTAYHSCDGSTSMTASGRTAKVGYVAHNGLPIGSWIEMVRPRTVMDRKWFQVMDRGGPSFLVDFWAKDCSWMHAFGRRTITIKAVPRSELYRGKPMKGWSFRRGSKSAKLVWRAK